MSRIHGFSIHAIVAPTLYAFLVAVLLLLLQPPASLYAAEIPVTGSCTLVDAVLAAENDNAAGDCPAGSGADLLILDADGFYTLTTRFAGNPIGFDTGLPVITSTITISGNGATILRDRTLSCEPDEPTAFRMFYVSTPGDLTLDDVTVRNGCGNVDGAGLYLQGAILTVHNSRILENSGGFGCGGVYSSSNSGVVIEDSKIVSNTGGGLCNIGGVLQIRGSEILSNTDDIYGGIFNFLGTTTLEDTLVQGNTPDGLYSVGDAVIKGSTIQQNARNGLNNNYCQSCDPDVDGMMTVEASNILSNTRAGIFQVRYFGSPDEPHTSALSVTNQSRIAGNLNSGIVNGGIGSVLVADSVIIGNAAPGEDGIFACGGGGINSQSGGPLVVRNSQILSNTAPIGGGLCGGQDTIIENSQVLYNRAELGAGIYQSGAMTLTGQSLVAHNFAEQAGGAIYIPFGEVSVYVTETLILSNSAGEQGGAIYSGSPLVHINQSCIVGNSDTAVSADAAPFNSIDTTAVWWGAPDGPSGVGSGGGDSVSENVTFHPYFTHPILGCPIITDLGLAVAVSVNTQQAFVGDTITYTYRITNTGLVTLTSISAFDDRVGEINGLAGELAPNQSRTVVVSHTVQSVAYPLVNTVTVTGTDSMNKEITRTASASLVVDLLALEVTKYANTTQAVVGQVITYTYVVTNNSTALVDISAVDDRLGHLPELEGTAFTGEVRTATRSVVLEEDDVPQPLGNRVVVTATESFGSNRSITRTASANLTVKHTDTLALDVTKSANLSHALVGETITYSYRITNTGTAFLDITGVVDDQLGVLAELEVELAPQASASTIRTHLVVEDDLPGPLVNTVTVTATDALDSRISASDTVTVSLAGEADLAIIVSTSVAEAHLGDTITYTYRITNSGTVTLSDVEIEDERLGSSFSIGTLAPNQIAERSHAYVVQESALPGSLVNTATVTGTDIFGTVITASASTTVTILSEGEQLPQLFLPQVER